MKILSKDERDFLICTDCSYFKFMEIIDENYPEIVRGRCTLYDKLVDNRWQSNCPSNDGEDTCYSCIHFWEDEDGDEFCSLNDYYIDCYEKCEKFSKCYE